MTNLEALKLVYAALGGSAEIPAGATNADVIAMIATQAAALYTAATTPELPSVTQTQHGKVLTVNSSGKWAAANVPTELPAVTSGNAGEVLTVSAQGAWAAAALPTELPAVTSEDAGDVLTVSAQGAWEAAALPGG